MESKIVFSKKSYEEKERSNIYRHLLDRVITMWDILTLILRAGGLMRIDRDVLRHKGTGRQLWYHIRYIWNQRLSVKKKIMQRCDNPTYITIYWMVLYQRDTLTIMNDIINKNQIRNLYDHQLRENRIQG